MSLIKFLTAGKCLDSVRDNSCRYRMHRRNALPKFGSPKNPFAQPPKSDADEPSNCKSPGDNSNPVKMETGSLFAAADPKPEAARQIKVTMPRRPEAVKVEIKRVETNPIATVAPGAAASESSAQPRNDPAPPKQKSSGWFSWARRLNPVSFLFNRPGGFMGRNRAGRNPVQTELSLERVQVVRNDLRDTDLEIVPGRLMGIHSGASPVLANAPQPESGGLVRLASRLLGAQKTQI